VKLNWKGRQKESSRARLVFMDCISPDTDSLTVKTQQAPSEGQPAIANRVEKVFELNLRRLNGA
jgi:hypothetical protein